MKAFFNDESIKKKYVDRVIYHQKADNLIRGTGWDGQKGCAVGCTLENYHHASYESELAIPEWLARLEDSLFEGMSEQKSRTWPEVFLKSIPLGFDKWGKLRKEFLIFICEENLKYLDNCVYDADENPKVKAAIDQTKEALKMVIKYHKNDLGNDAAEAAAWAAWAAVSAAEAAGAARAAVSAARAAWAARAAVSAARAAWAAVSAAEAAGAAWAAVSAAGAARAAVSAARAAGAAEAAEEAYDKYADKLIELFGETK